MDFLHNNIKLKDNLAFRLTILVGAALLIILREPQLFLYPRLWAEEGTIFYAFARHHSVWNIFTTAHVGYLTLFNSIVSSIQAKIFSVENVAVVSTYMGFLIQLMPVYIIAFTNNKFWDSPLKKIICSFIVIIVMATELWLNTTNSHFIMGLITFLIMVISAATLSKAQKYFFRILLIIGGLTGPASIFFTPTFLLKAYRERSREKYIQAGILLLCAIIQAGVILYAIFFNNTYKRLSVHDLKTTRYHFIIDNFSLLPHSRPFNYHVLSFDFITLFGIMIGIFYAYLLIRNIRNFDNLIPLISLGVVGVFSTLGSLDMAGGTRYAYIPTCILLIILTSEAFTFLVSKAGFAALFIICFCLTSNSIVYRQIFIQWAYKTDYPKWKNEVFKWRADSTYKPVIHPLFIKNGGEWKIKM